jgi:hypothetical protein
MEHRFDRADDSNRLDVMLSCTEGPSPDSSDRTARSDRVSTWRRGRVFTAIAGYEPCCAIGGQTDGNMRGGQRSTR